MLVLNRRPGESVIIEPDVHVTVLSVADRRVRISVTAPGVPTLRVSASVISADDARLEIGPLAAVSFDGPAVRVDIAPEGHPGCHAQPALAINRAVGERVHVANDAWIAMASVSKGNPCIGFGGPAIGEEVRITLIRPAGSYVRLGVEAPNRRVYREELWAAMQAAGALDERVGRFDHVDGDGTRDGHAPRDGRLPRGAPRVPTGSVSSTGDAAQAPVYSPFSDADARGEPPVPVPGGPVAEPAAEQRPAGAPAG